MRKQQEEGGLWSFSPPFSPEPSHKTLMLQVPSLYEEERNIPISKTERHWEEPIEQTLLSSTHFITFSSSFCPITFLHYCPLFIKLSIKTPCCNHFFRSVFPYEGSHVTWNVYYIKIHAFLCHSVFLHLIFRLIQGL